MDYYEGYPYYGPDYRQNGNQMGAQPGGPMGNQSGTQMGGLPGMQMSTPLGSPMGTQPGTQMSTPPGSPMGTQPGTQMGTPPGPPMGTQPGAQQEPQGSPDIKSMCERYMNYHVIGQLSDGSRVEGILDGADSNSVTMLVPEDMYEDDRIYGYGGFGRRRFRRFRRRRFPLNFFIFPFFVPFPYYY